MLTFNVANETVCVGETESKLLTKCCQPTIVIEFILDEFHNFQYRETDGVWFRQHDFHPMILHECQNFVDNHWPLLAGFRNSVHKFGRVDNQPHIDLFADIFDRLAIKVIGNQFVQKRFKVRFRIFLPVVTILDKW